MGLSVFSRSSGSTGSQSPSIYRSANLPSRIYSNFITTQPTIFFDAIYCPDNLQYPLIRFTSCYLNSLFVDFIRERVQLEGLSYNDTKRQAECQAAHQAARSHWNALWCSKIGPRSIPKRHGKRQNSKASADAWHLTLDAPLDAWCGYSFSACPLPPWGLVVLGG